MSKVKTIIGITCFSLLHFVASMVAFGIFFGLGMDRFDNGGDPTLLENASEVAMNILWFPLLHLAILAQIHNNALEWLFVISNSVLWGALLFGVFAVAVRKARQRTAWRFGLRTLLIATTVVAAILGAAVWAMK